MMTKEIHSLVMAVGIVIGILINYAFNYEYRTEMQALLDEIKEYKEKPFNITVTWDIPAEHIGADLPPLPVRKP